MTKKDKVENQENGSMDLACARPGGSCGSMAQAQGSSAGLGCVYGFPLTDTM